MVLNDVKEAALYTAEAHNYVLEIYSRGTSLYYEYSTRKLHQKGTILRVFMLSGKKSYELRGFK